MWWMRPPSDPDEEPPLEPPPEVPPSLLVGAVLVVGVVVVPWSPRGPVGASA
jgi:hypothetical protein